MTSRCSALLLLLASCATVAPRFPQDIEASFAGQDMRRLETEHLQLYFPARYQEASRRIAARLEQCAVKLRALEPAQRERGRFLVFLTDDNFNNAYVQPPILGTPQQMVLAIHMTLETFDFYDIGIDAAGDVSCHESVHYVTFEQIEGFWRGLNLIFGDLLSPESFLDMWLHEGMATYYEARLGKPVGRPMSPFWRGAFAAGVASEDNLDAGYLNAMQRLQEPYGAQYMTGLAFVTWLASHYGEDKLWELIDKQGRSIFSPLGVTLRFKTVFGKSVGALFDDFVRDTKANVAQRTRPAAQHTLAADLGSLARLAAAPDGTTALISVGLDEPTRLIIRGRDGRERVSRRLANVLPPRPWIVASPVAVSGMSFSADSRWLYLVSADVGSDGGYTGQLWEVDAQTGSVERIWHDVPGPGGCLTADSQGYVTIEIEGDVTRLVRLSLADGRRETLHTFPPGTSVAAPACSPDGERLAFIEHGDHGSDLHLREADDSITRLTNDGRFNTQPRWLNETQLLFVRELDGRAQAHVLDTTTKAIWATTDAPFGVFDPAPIGGSELAFLNRDGWGFSLDTAPVLPAAPTLASDTDQGLDAEPPTQVEPALPLVVQSDEPYSSTDHLFVPALHVPYIDVLPLTSSNKSKGNSGTSSNSGTNAMRLIGSLSLQGSDRLNFHSWAVNVSYDSKDQLPSAQVAYGNYLLAPWLMDFSGSLINVGPRYDRFAQLGFSRTFWTTPLRLQLVGIEHYEVDTDSNILGHYRFVGPGLQTAYFGVESTPYGGIQRGVGLAFAGNYYAKAAKSDFDMGDLSGEMDVWLPLPLSRRHGLMLSGRGRTLLTASPRPLIDVGGVVVGQSFGRLGLGNATQAADTQLLAPPTLSFSEFLRGYQDLSTPATAYTVASATYTYPFIVDYGWASLAYLLPAFFVRQIDIDFFGEMAWLWRPGLVARRSAGGALYLRTSLGGAPLSFYAQLAARFLDGERLPPGVAPWLTVIGLSSD